MGTSNTIGSGSSLECFPIARSHTLLDFKIQSTTGARIKTKYSHCWYLHPIISTRVSGVRKKAWNSLCLDKVNVVDLPGHEFFFFNSCGQPGFEVKQHVKFAER